MTESSANIGPRWQKTAAADIVRYVQSKNEYAIIRLRGKLIWKSPKNDRISVAKSLLNDFHKERRIQNFSVCGQRAEKLHSAL